MECYACGGEMKKVHKDIETNWKGRTVVFRGLEAWVCETCGEQAYEANDARLMQNLIRATELDVDQPEVMNVEEVADLLRVSTQTVYNLARSGKLPAVKIGREWRFRRDEILAVLSKEHQAAAVSEDTPIYRVARGKDENGLSDRDKEIIERHIRRLKSD
jgi:excisionase family DNA binding protein/YgiT-type zinc finger domain-containing protein